jgi:hypothetical protein
LEDWITLEVSDGGKIDHTRIKHRDGASLRLFLGPENTYFVYDGSTGEFHHNIQTREFRDWVNKCQKPVDEHMNMPDDRLILKLGSAPHSLALGPNDMFCWICENDFKVNDSFRDVFPSIKIFLDYAKRRKMLSQVVSLPSELPLFNSQQLTSTARCLPPARITNLARSNHTSFCQPQMASASAQYPQMRLM